jgi:branched-subunit amino acid ABC-type transport system permease component
MSQLLSAIIAGIVYGAALSTAGAAFTLQFGVTNYFNLAFGALLGFAAMVAVSLNAASFHWNIWIAGAVAVIATAVLAVLLNRILYAPFLNRRRNIFIMILVTFAVAILLSNIFLIFWGTSFTEFRYTPGPTLHFVGATVTTDQVIYVLVAGACLIAVQLLLKYTSLGRSMRAMSDNFSLASIAGLNVRRITDLTWMMTGLLAGVAGILLALETHSFNASIGSRYEYFIFIAVILGGIGEPVGAFLGGILIGVVTEVSGLILPSGMSPVAALAILILVMLLKPQGLLGVPGRLGRAI